MEDIIPLLIVIAISIIGAIGRKKNKRENPKNSAPKSQPQGNDIFDWLEKISDEGHEVKESVQHASQAHQAGSENQYANKNTDETEATINSTNDYSAYNGFISPEEKTKLMKKEGISTVKKRESTIYKNDERQTDKIKTPPKNKRKKLKRDFNLKQAVIYSEILNPKYKL